MLLNGDTIPVIMKRLGTPLKGDAELHLLGEMPLPISQALSTTTVTNATNASTLASDDKTALIAKLNKHKVIR